MMTTIQGAVWKDYSLPHIWTILEAVFFLSCCIAAYYLNHVYCTKCGVPAVGVSIYNNGPSVVGTPWIQYVTDDSAPDVAVVAVRIPRTTRPTHLIVIITDLGNVDECNIKNGRFYEREAAIGSESVPNGLGLTNRSVYRLSFFTNGIDATILACPVSIFPLQRSASARTVAFVPPEKFSPDDSGDVWTEVKPIKFSVSNDDPAGVDMVIGSRMDSGPDALAAGYLVDRQTQPVALVRWDDSRLAGAFTFKMFFLAAAIPLLFSDLLRKLSDWWGKSRDCAIT